MKGDLILNNSEKKFGFLITLIIISFMIVGVNAFGTSNPSVFGHSAKELDFSSGIISNAIFNGNVEVLGNIKLGNSGNSCSSGNEGSLRYNPSGKVFEFCDGLSWNDFSRCDSSGSQSFTTSGDYTFIVTENMIGCTFNIDVTGGSGAKGGGSGSVDRNPGAGGKINFNFVPEEAGNFTMVVGGKASGRSGGYGGGGNAPSAWAYGGGGGGASLLAFNNNLLAISGGGGGANANKGGDGGSGNNKGEDISYVCGTSLGGNDGVGGTGPGENGADYNPEILFPAKGGDGQPASCGGQYCNSGAGAGAGYGGGGGSCQRYGSPGGGAAGGGGFLNTSMANSFTTSTGALNSDGQITFSWSK